MPLKYALFENHLTGDPDDYMAKVQDLLTSSFDDLIDLMIGRGSTVTRAEALAVLEEFFLALAQRLREGRSVNTPLFNVTPTIRGVFDGPNDAFDAARHEVRLNVRPGVRLRQIASEIQVERVSVSAPTPKPLTFTDVNSESRNATITPGGLGTLTGRRLKHDPDDVQQGIFFLDAVGAETRVAVISVNKPATLHFQIPPTLAPGAYTVEVRAPQYSGTAVRTGPLPHVLQVP